MAGKDDRKDPRPTVGTKPSKSKAQQETPAGARDITPSAKAGVAFSWMPIAEDEVGVKEVPGLRHNPRILEYHKTTTLKATTDEVPWCSSFVNWVMLQAGYTGTKSAAARSWANWGIGLVDPVPGCIVVMTRGEGGHVGFYVRHDADYLWLLGGNQNNEVKVSMFDMRKRRLLGYVLPKHMNDNDRGLYELYTRGVV